MTATEGHNSGIAAAQLRQQAEAMARFAALQVESAADYSRKADEAELPGWAEHYRRRAAACLAEAEWYSRQAADRQAWAETPPESAEEMHARIGEMLRKDVAA